MKQPDQSDRLEKLVNQLKEQLHVLGSESHEDSILKGLVDVQGLTEMTQGMLKDAERRLAGCRQHAPGPRNAPFLVPFTDASCSGSLIENDQDQPFRGPSKQFSAYLVLGVLGLSLGGYALHEHRLAQNFAAQAEHEAAHDPSCGRLGPQISPSFKPVLPLATALRARVPTRVDRNSIGQAKRLKTPKARWWSGTSISPAPIRS